MLGLNTRYYLPNPLRVDFGSSNTAIYYNMEMVEEDINKGMTIGEMQRVLWAVEGGKESD